MAEFIIVEQQSSLSLLREAKMLVDESPINIVNVTCHGFQEEALSSYTYVKFHFSDHE